jgi:lipid A ethanolaminephosphotransferase
VTQSTTLNRILRKPETLVFAFCLWAALTCNFGYWAIVGANTTTGFLPGLAFLANMTLVTLGLISLVMLVLAVGPLTRMVLTLSLLVSAAAGYFTYKFGTLIDADMLVNVIETNPAEASELLTVPFIAAIVFFGALPAIAVWKYPLNRRRLPIAIRDRGVALLLAISMIAGPLYFSQKEVVSFGRNHREVRHAIAPVNAIVAGIVLARDALETPPEFLDVGVDAVHTSAGNDRLPRVHVLIVGETARAANFSLNGYPRNTNPELQARTDVVYTTAASCGTATATSLPCMLTLGGRTGFDRAVRRNQDNLLDIAARSGYSVHWLDNGNGCKGLCDRIDSRDLHLAAVDPFCSETECFDEILVHELKNLLRDIKGDTLIVLHPLGSHGPAYFRRYPDEYRRFVPDCRSVNFADCTIEEIVNSYDNTIAYTDHVIAAAIDALAAESGHISPSLTYMSDHGESLGEHNMFLHGMPYNLAPDEQKQVPMISWFGDTHDQVVGLSSRCAQSSEQQEISHDNLFHTELGLLDIETSAYDTNLDIYSDCMTSAPFLAAGGQ